MMTSQILKSVDFIKMQKSRYLENETVYQGLLYCKNSFVAEATFLKPAC